jgi:hypothetical protein
MREVESANYVIDRLERQPRTRGRLSGYFNRSGGNELLDDIPIIESYPFMRDKGIIISKISLVN